MWLINRISSGNLLCFGRFDNWLASHLKLPPNYFPSYSGNYTDDAKSWRLVEISRLTTKYQHDQADKRICASLSKTKTCSIERVLRKTERFQKWLKAKRLTPDLVQVSRQGPVNEEHTDLAATAVTSCNRVWGESLIASFVYFLNFIKNQGL